MKLETRIEQLEHELKILKNEIQGTLLDIQEQILIHYYPALRGDDSEPPDALAGLVDAVRNGRKISSERAARPVTSFRLDEVDQDEDDDEVRLSAPPPGPQHRNSAGKSSISKLPRRERDFLEESFEDEDEDDEDETGMFLAAKPKTHESPSVEPRRTGRKIANPHTNTFGVPAYGGKRQEPARVNFSALAEWTAEGIARLGKERTRKTIETYANGGYVAAEVKEMLLQLVELAEEEEPAQPPTSKDSMELLVKLDQVLGGQA